MRQKRFLITLLGLILTTSGFTAIETSGAVISDMKDPNHMTDGNIKTLSISSARTNTVIMQYGRLYYLDGLDVLLGQKTSLDKVTVSVSSDFFTWSVVTIIDKVDADKLDIPLKGVAASFIKIEIFSEKGLSIREIYTRESSAPKNEIYDIRVTDLGENSVHLTWKTKIETQDHISYVKKYGGAQETIIDLGYKKEHSITLKNLVKGSEYIYRIVSESPDTTRLESAELSFTTKGIPLPEFWRLEAREITPFSAKLFYRSNVPTAYEIFWGTNRDQLTQKKSDNWQADNRDIELTGLLSETEYFYQLYLKDRFNNVLMTPIIGFVTPPNNIALGKKVWGSFNYVDEGIKEKGFGESKIERVVDGNINYFTGMAISYNADFADQYVIIDLEKVEPIERLDVYWWGISYSSDYQIDLSDDGKTWTTVISNADAENGTEIRSPEGNLLVKHVLPVKMSARYVRLFVQAKNKRGTRMKQYEQRVNLYLCELAVIKK